MVPVNDLAGSGDAAQGHPPRYVLSPSPVLWMQEFEQSNPAPGRLPVWRELSMRARQRGSKAVAGKNWSGPVLLPSSVVAQMLDSGRIRVPERWRDMPKRELCRFVAMLNAWQTSRYIFDFAELAGEVVLNGQVSMPMTPRSFSLLPAAAIYIDFESLDIHSKRLPGGVFAGLDVDDAGRMELVLVVDRFDNVRVHALTLNGSALDNAMHSLLVRSRDKHADVTRARETALFVDHHLHTVLSAVLLVSCSQGVFEHVEDGVSCAHGHGLWTRWRVRKLFTPAVQRAYTEALQRMPGHAPVVVAQWAAPFGDNVANLRCSVGDRRAWADVAGMPAEFRMESGSRPAMS